MRIGVVHPVRGGGPKFVEVHTAEWQAVAAPDTELVTAVIEDGPDTLLNAAESAQAQPHILEQVRRLDGTVDAIVISCFCDPGLAEARAIAQVPVIGVGEASMFLASQSAERFAIVTIVDPPYMEKVAAKAGFGEHLTSVRFIDVPVHELRSETAAVLSAIEREMKDAAATEGAEMVCLGCCSLTGLKAQVEATVGLPAVDPKVAAMAIAESAARIASMRTGTAALAEMAAGGA